MRILTIGNMYPPHSLGGYELMWSSWVEHVQAAGHDVRVLTTDFEIEGGPTDAPDSTDDVRRELRWYWRDHGFPRLSPRARLALERHNAEVLNRHLRDFEPDAVVWWAMAGMSIGLIERVRRAGLPAVGVLADYWLGYARDIDAWMRPFLRRPRLGRLVERLTGAITGADLGSAMTFVFVSEAVRERARQAWPDLGESEVVQHGPDVELFREAPSREWGWDLLYVGRIDRRKGIDLAVLALTHLPEEATLTVIGSGDDDYLAELRDTIREHGLIERVRFAQRPRHELPAAYAEGDAVLFPVRWEEPFGLVPLEAMAVSRPVIATGRGGSGEYLRDGENCLLFDPADDDPARGARQLAERARALAADAELRERLREGGRRTVDSLSAKRFNERVVAAVERALEASGHVRKYGRDH